VQSKYILFTMIFNFSKVVLWLFSSSAPGSFALAFTTPSNGTEKATSHILINSCMPDGFTIQEQENQQSRTFQSLYEIVEYYSIYLQYPLNSELPFER
jgi:hypothetical protein